MAEKQINRDRDPFIYEIFELVHKLGLAVLPRTKNGLARPNFIIHSGLDWLFGLHGLMRIQFVERDPISKFIPE